MTGKLLLSEVKRDVWPELAFPAQGIFGIGRSSGAVLPG